MCDHKGWALWANHYAWYCANCGVHNIDYRLLPHLSAHRMGEPAGWDLDPDVRDLGVC